MVWNLLKYPVLTDTKGGCMIMLYHLMYDDEKHGIAEPLIDENIAIKWSLVLVRNTDYKKVNKLEVKLRFLNAENFVDIHKIIPEPQEREIANVGISAGLPGFSTIDVRIPKVKRTIRCERIRPDEVKWVFNELEFPEQENEMIVQGAVQVAFLKGAERRDIYPILIGEAVFEKGLFGGQQRPIINCGPEHVRSLKPSISETPMEEDLEMQGLTASGLFYFNANGDVMSENRQKINKLFSQVSSESKELKLLFYTGVAAFSTTAGSMYESLMKKKEGRVNVLLLDPHAEEVIHERCSQISCDLQRYAMEIEISKKFCKQHRLIDCRLFKESSPWRLVIADDEKVYVQFYLPGKEGIESAIYGFDAFSPTSLGAAFIRYFNTLFERSSRI